MANFKRNTGILVNTYLYSTVGAQFESYTLDASCVTQADANSNKYVNKGELMAKITSGAASGKVGPYEAGASDGREDVANLVGYNDTWALLTDGMDKDIACLQIGTVENTKVIVDLVKGAPSSTITDALRTVGLDILHRTG